MGITKDDTQKIFEPVGCDHCDGVGYKGRIAIIEVLRFSEAIDEMVAEQLTIGKIKQCLKEEGFITMAEDAVRRVLEGLTTLDEVSRVINLTDRLES